MLPFNTDCRDALGLARLPIKEASSGFESEDIIADDVEMEQLAQSDPVELVFLLRFK